MIRIFLLLCIFTLCSAEAHYYANEPAVNVFRYPDLLGEMATQIIYGTEVEILSESGDWIKIRTPHEFEGWCLKDQLIFLERPYPSTKKAKVNSIWTYLYSIDDTTPHPIAFTLPFDAEVEVITSDEYLNERWMNVRLLDGTILFAIRCDFSFETKPLTLDEVLQLSKNFLNLPYIWAGTSGFGFDCSGFTHTLFKLMGVFIPRNSKLQANFELFIPIELEDTLPGDLLFFGKRKITHVGLYLGNDEFIHSFAGDKDHPAMIQISNIHEEKWTNELICIRRYPREELSRQSPGNDPIQSIH